MAEVQNHHLTFKIILIGDSGVGKTCLIDKFCHDHFNPLHEITIGVEFGSRVVNLELPDKNIRVKCQFWDTAGQEMFKSITRSYYRGVAGIILCYDMTRTETFYRLNTWLQDIRRECDPGSKIILIGTKLDLYHLKKISTEEGQKYAKENNMLFYEVSAKTGINIKDAISKLIHEIYNGYIAGAITNGVKDVNDVRVCINQKKIPENKKCC